MPSKPVTAPRKSRMRLFDIIGSGSGIGIVIIIMGLALIVVFVLCIWAGAARNMSVHKDVEKRIGGLGASVEAAQAAMEADNYQCEENSEKRMDAPKMELFCAQKIRVGPECLGNELKLIINLVPGTLFLCRGPATSSTFKRTVVRLT